MHDRDAGRQWKIATGPTLAVSWNARHVTDQTGSHVQLKSASGVKKKKGQEGCVSLHNAQCFSGKCYILQMLTSEVKKKQKTTQKLCRNCGGCSHNPISFWSLQQWMELSQKRKSGGCLLSDAAACKSGQLRWMLRPRLWRWWKVLFLFVFSFLFFASFSDSLHFRYLSAPGRVVSHSTATGLDYEKICRQSVSHIIIFLPSPLDRKNSWRAQIVLRIPFQPLRCSGQSSRILFGFDRSKKIK